MSESVAYTQALANAGYPHAVVYVTPTGFLVTNRRQMFTLECALSSASVDGIYLAIMMRKVDRDE